MPREALIPQNWFTPSPAPTSLGVFIDWLQRVWFLWAIPGGAVISGLFWFKVEGIDQLQAMPSESKYMILIGLFGTFSFLLLATGQVLRAVAQVSRRMDPEMLCQYIARTLEDSHEYIVKRTESAPAEHIPHKSRRDYDEVTAQEWRSRFGGKVLVGYKQLWYHGIPPGAGVDSSQTGVFSEYSGHIRWMMGSPHWIRQLTLDLSACNEELRAMTLTREEVLLDSGREKG